MTAEKLDYEDTFYFGTIKSKNITIETENGLITNSQLRVDYNKDSEAYGFGDYKDHYMSNKNGYNLVYKVEGQNPVHIHDSFDDGWFIQLFTTLDQGR